MTNKCCGSKTALWLAGIGAINWGIYGVAGLMGKSFDLVTWITFGQTWLANIIFVVVGIAGIVALWGCKCSMCKVTTEPSCDSCEDGRCDVHGEKKVEVEM